MMELLELHHPASVSTTSIAAHHHYTITTPYSHIIYIPTLAIAKVIKISKSNMALLPCVCGNVHKPVRNSITNDKRV